MIALIVVIAGLLVGLVMGALGGGGAIMTVPLLTFALGLPPTHATVGSLVVVISGAISGLVSHLRRRHVRPGIGVFFGALGTGGAVLAANVSGLMDDAVLLTLFSALLVVVAAAMIVKNTRRRSSRPSSNHDGPENRLV
ncbi:sulfite exporter TauE/SafE family protein [Kocuria marina]|uniref:sulfite exporter TauE/SafE family protein n=1 Tax=Kocuria marina TaxID=223184 RepID=UPI00164301C4|nr:sulfite exporter TauE/SafE family protein [Kocuria indica]